MEKASFLINGHHVTCGCYLHHHIHVVDKDSHSEESDASLPSTGVITEIIPKQVCCNTMICVIISVEVMDDSHILLLQQIEDIQQKVIFLNFTFHFLPHTFRLKIFNRRSSSSTSRFTSSPLTFRFLHQYIYFPLQIEHRYNKLYKSNKKKEH